MSIFEEYGAFKAALLSAYFKMLFSDGSELLKKYSLL